jgi:predicted transcriptional regulator
VIPLENEIDRAVAVFEDPNGFKANKIFLLTTLLPGDHTRELKYYHGVVKTRFEDLGIEVVSVQTNIWDMLDIIKNVSRVVREEKDKGNLVYVNMSAGGAFVSVGTALSAMTHGANLYYVRCARYSEKKKEKLKHGNAICDPFELHYIENFNIQMPDQRGQIVLTELLNRGEIRTNELLDILNENEVEGFAKKSSSLNRGEKISVLMRLNKGITSKLEKMGYLTKEKRGRDNIYRITESGKYIACISGLIKEPTVLHSSSNLRP